MDLPRVLPDDGGVGHEHHEVHEVDEHEDAHADADGVVGGGVAL